ncbi:hypothetical protein [Amaricoccus tamworthensis]|uniref:hypothetical protein n=1 Tax=Amaricoccus tamworthensis TaxID=57002 RepID=UPI003C7DC3CD
MAIEAITGKNPSPERVPFRTVSQSLLLNAGIPRMVTACLDVPRFREDLVVGVSARRGD